MEAVEDDISYRKIQLGEITRNLFESFIRKQIVSDCWRKENGSWSIKREPFIDDWDDNDYELLILDLKKTVASNGFMYGAFIKNKLKGFITVEGTFIGSKNQYIDISELYVSSDMRRRGIGKVLFSFAKAWAKENDKKLYISAHSSVESQAFYYAMGCIEAEEYIMDHVKREPYDCQLECDIK